MTISLPRYGTTDQWSSRNITIATTPLLSHLRLDPIVASFRLFAQNNYESRLQPSSVTMQLLPGIFYLQEETEIAVSVVLSDGRRLLLTDPNEIVLTSSNSSVVSVNKNKITGVNEGVVTLNVEWVVCVEMVMNKSIKVSVEFDQFRPFFSPNTDNATLPEDSPFGLLITTVEAIDEDVVDIHTDDVQYDIKNDPYNGLFVVERDTGAVRLNGILNRELNDSYIIEIEATDSVQRRQRQCFERQATASPPQPPTTAPADSLSGSGSASASGNRVDTDSGSGDTTDPPSASDNVTCSPVSPISVFTVSYLNTLP